MKTLQVIFRPLNKQGLLVLHRTDFTGAFAKKDSTVLLERLVFSASADFLHFVIFLLGFVVRGFFFIPQNAKTIPCKI